MDKIGSSERNRLLSPQVSGSRYFFLDLAPERRGGWAVTLGGRERCNPDYLVRRERYAYHVLEMVADGEGWVVLDGRRQELRPGQVFVYGPRTRCEIGTSRSRPLVKYFFCLAGAQAARRLKRAGLEVGRVRAVQPVAELTSTADDLIREGQAEGRRVREVCRHLLEIVLLKLEGLAADPEHETEPARERFLRCKALIDAEADSLLTLTEIARRSGLERSSVCRLFRRYQGSSPYQYLLRRKMTVAAEQLMAHGGLVKEVASRVGFADPYHFSRVFKAVHGVAPSALPHGRTPEERRHLPG